MNNFCVRAHVPAWVKQQCQAVFSTRLIELTIFFNFILIPTKPRLVQEIFVKRLQITNDG